MTGILEGLNCHLRNTMEKVLSWVTLNHCDNDDTGYQGGQSSKLRASPVIKLQEFVFTLSMTCSTCFPHIGLCARCRGYNSKEIGWMRLLLEHVWALNGFCEFQVATMLVISDNGCSTPGTRIRVYFLFHGFYNILHNVTLKGSITFKLWMML
jgi:hypothetical protein